MSQVSLQRKLTNSSVPYKNVYAAKTTALSPAPARKAVVADASTLVPMSQTQKPSLFRENMPRSTRKEEASASVEDSMEDLIALPISNDILSSRDRAERQRQYIISSLPDNAVALSRSRSSSLNHDNSGYNSSDSRTSDKGKSYTPSKKSRIPSRKRADCSQSESDSEHDLSNSSLSFNRSCSSSSRELSPEISMQMSTFNADYPQDLTSIARSSSQGNRLKPSRAQANAQAPAHRKASPTAFPSSTPSPRRPKAAMQATEKSLSNSSPSVRPRAVTGNLSARKKSTQRNFTTPGSTPTRPRSMSATSLSPDSLRAPFASDDSPELYRSDLMPPPNSLEALSNRSNMTPSHSARTFDDLIIPTVAKQVYQKLLEDNVQDGLIVEYHPDGTPKKAVPSMTSARVLADKTNQQDIPLAQLSAPASQGDKLSLPASDNNEPFSTLSTRPERTEIWNLPELASPTIAKQTFAAQREANATLLDNQSNAAKTSSKPVARDDEEGAGCCRCIIC